MSQALASPLPQAEPYERRREARLKCRPLDLRMETSVFIDTVRLVNIGRLGFSVNTVVAYPAGTALWLHIPGHGKVQARAVWHARNQLGGRFEYPLDEELLLSLSEAR